MPNTSQNRNLTAVFALALAMTTWVKGQDASAIESMVVQHERALKTATQTEQKKRILSELSIIPTFSALNVTMKFAGDPEIGADAALAALNIADRVAADNAGMSRLILRRLMDTSGSQEVARRANAILERLQHTETATMDRRLNEIQEVLLFNGRSLEGWEGDSNVFTVKGGAIVAGSSRENLPRNEFLCTRREFRDFELRLKFKLLGQRDKANAGVQIRSRRIPGHNEMIGYQADIGQSYWGALYDESRRKKVLAQPPPELLKEAVRHNEWNDYRIRCIGRRIELWLNGRKTVDYLEDDLSIEQGGLIAVQVHAGPPTEVWYKDIFVKELPATVLFAARPINPDSRFEAATIADLNRDGRPDIFSGGFWYEAPHWEKHFVRHVEERDDYYLDFGAIPLDVDGDGWTDMVSGSWHGQDVFWLRNPATLETPVEVFTIDRPGNLETAIGADLNGDSQTDILPNTVKRMVWYEFERDANSPGGARWIKHELPPETAGHGIGAGDVNGDDRTDIVAPKGWLEQPSNKNQEWRWHPDFDLGAPSVPILVHDVDNDSDSDIIWGVGHSYGLYWLEQQKTAGGSVTWKKHVIDATWSQPHFLILADLDRDGNQELITGKRYRAHALADPGSEHPLCVYYYRWDRQARQWDRRPVHEGGQVGFGIYTAAGDIDGDGDIDIVAPGKSGLYLLENLLIR